jgi:hypothetical protein
MQLAAQHLAEIVEAVRQIEGGGAGREKRRAVRHPVVARVQVLAHATGRTYSALTQDLSLEGIGLVQSIPIAKGEQIAVSLPGSKYGPLVALCNVMHTRELGEGVWSVGAIFLSLATQSAPTKDDASEAQRISAKMLD